MNPSSEEDHQKLTRHEEIQLGAHVHVWNPEEHGLVFLRAAGHNRHSPTSSSTSRLLRMWWWSPAFPFPVCVQFPTYKLGKGRWKFFSWTKDTRTRHHWLKPICFQNPWILLLSSLGHSYWPLFYVLQGYSKQSNSSVWRSFTNRAGQKNAQGNNTRCYSGMENKCLSRVSLKN